VVQAAVGYQAAWRRRMQKNINRLDDHFIVCGIGRVGRTVCRRLTEASIPFVVVEKDDGQFESARSCGFLAIHGVASEDAVLLRAGIERARGVVCAVDSDSENIVITLSARELNPKTVIVSRADAEDIVPKIKRAGASHVVSPSLRGGEDIANLLTRPHLTDFIEQSRRTDSDYKLGEVTVDANSVLVGRTLREYGAQERSVAFLAVKHADGTTRIRPGADEAFRPGDVVIVVGEPEGVYRMSSAAEPVPICS